MLQTQCSINSFTLSIHSSFDTEYVYTFGCLLVYLLVSLVRSNLATCLLILAVFEILNSNFPPPLEVCVCVCVCVRARACVLSRSVMSNSAIPWTVTHQAPLSVEILQERKLVCVAMPPPGDLPNPGLEPID